MQPEDKTEEENKMSGVFDKTHRTPVDITAAKVISRGTHYKPLGKFVGFHADLCPPLKSAYEMRQLDKQHDLTRRKFGRFTVVGMSRLVAARWVVRCVCGQYEMRSSRAAKNPENQEDCCEACRKPIQAHRSHLYRQSLRK